MPFMHGFGRTPTTTPSSGGAIRPGDTIRTGAGSSVTLMLKDRTAFIVSENASVRVRRRFAPGMIAPASASFRLLISLAGSTQPTIYLLIIAGS
jgi:hypothetical protein